MLQESSSIATRDRALKSSCDTCVNSRGTLPAARMRDKNSTRRNLDGRTGSETQPQNATAPPASRTVNGTESTRKKFNPYRWPIKKFKTPLEYGSVPNVPTMTMPEYGPTQPETEATTAERLPTEHTDDESIARAEDRTVQSQFESSIYAEGEETTMKAFRYSSVPNVLVETAHGPTCGAMSEFIVFSGGERDWRTGVPLAARTAPTAERPLKIQA